MLGPQRFTVPRCIAIYDALCGTRYTISVRRYTAIHDTVVCEAAFDFCEEVKFQHKPQLCVSIIFRVTKCSTYIITSFVIIIENNYVLFSFQWPLAIYEMWRCIVRMRIHGCVSAYGPVRSHWPFRAERLFLFIKL